MRFRQTSTRGPAPGTQPVADTDSDSKSKLQSTDSKQDLGANQRKGSTNKLLIKKRSHAKVISEGSGDVMKSESVEDNKSRDANSGDSKSSSSGMSVIPPASLFILRPTWPCFLLWQFF